MLTSLWLPILLSGAALFFASFISWMVVQLHKKDWGKLPNEDTVMKSLREQNAPLGSYMFPYCDTPEQMKSEAHQKKYQEGPRGVLTLMNPVNMGQNLGLTLLYFMAVSGTLGYLASFALPAGAPFLNVFRFVGTAGLLAFLSAILQHAIWFRNRIAGHVVESVAYALITGLIFAACWPAA